MSKYFDIKDDLSRYSNALVFMKNDKNPVIQLSGGNIAVDRNDESITITTANSYTVCSADDVLAITFK